MQKVPKLMEELQRSWVAVHPAEKAAMASMKGVHRGNSDEDILKDLRSGVFKVPLLQNTLIVQILEEVDAKLYRAYTWGLQSSSYLRSASIDLFLRIYSCSTLNKNLFEKYDFKIDKGTIKDSTKDFILRSTVNLNHICELDSGVQIPYADLYEANWNSGLNRGVVETFFIEFQKIAKNYEDLQWQLFKAKLEQEPTSHLKLKIHEIEEALGLDRFGFGSVREIKLALENFATQRNMILPPYLRTVYSAARKTARNDHQMLENFQNGALGLFKAASCYSTRRGTAFSAVAKGWIKQSMLYSIKEISNFIRLPSSTWQLNTKLERIRYEKKIDEGDFETLATELGELGTKLKLNVQKIRENYDSIKSTQVYSIDKTYDDGKSTLADSIAKNDENESAESIFHDAALRYCAKSKASIRDKKILALCYGFLEPLLIAEDASKEVEVHLEMIRQNLFRHGYKFEVHNHMKPELVYRILSKDVIELKKRNKV